MRVVTAFTAALSAILPPACSVVEARGEGNVALLLPEEVEALGPASDGRMREYAMGRTCARRALSALGHPAVPIGRGRSGAPAWPAGITGSITHGPRYCAAVAAFQSELRAVGIDAEPASSLSRNAVARIAFGEERAWLERSARPGTCWERLLFSAKESVYKLWFQLTERYLGFEDVAVTIDAEARVFSAKLRGDGGRRAPGVPDAFSGRFLIDEGLILTAAFLPARTRVQSSCGSVPTQV